MKYDSQANRLNHDSFVAFGDSALGKVDSMAAAHRKKNSTTARKRASGDGKHLNPDAGQHRAAPGTVEADRNGRTDEQLINAYQHGDGKSFEELVARYQRELFHFLVRFTGDRASADDIFQETFLQVHQSASDFDPTRRFRPWLFTIAANKARDMRRAKARRPTSPLQASIGGSSDSESGEFIDLLQSSAQLPDEPMQGEELQQKVQKMVMTLPDHLREILLLSYFHQFPYKQISDILDIPLGTVKSRIRLAMNRLRALLDETK